MAFLSPLAVLYAFVSAVLMDLPTASVMYVVKTFRVLSLWIIVFVLEKAFLQDYIQHTFVHRGRPPQFLPFIQVALAFETITYVIPMLLIGLLNSRYKHPGDSFVIDARVMSALFVDYLVSTVVMAALGTIIALKVQDRRLFRYNHDGLRGIRAGALAFYEVSAAVLLVPFYLIAL